MKKLLLIALLLITVGAKASDLQSGGQIGGVTISGTRPFGDSSLYAATTAFVMAQAPFIIKYGYCTSTVNVKASCTGTFAPFPNNFLSAYATCLDNGGTPAVFPVISSASNGAVAFDVFGLNGAYWNANCYWMALGK